jgi:quercetin dioxygenase-like cupin family protein
MPSGRTIRLAVTTVAFAGLIVALNAAPAGATQGSKFAGTLLGRGTNVSHGTLPIKGDLDVVVVSNVVQPGGYSGWHSHPGGAIVVVAHGQITTYTSVGNHCNVTIYTEGQTFFEQPGQPLNAVNRSASVTTVIATFPGVPVGVPGPLAWRTDEADPGTC